jgi:hypothetical protein
MKDSPFAVSSDADVILRVAAPSLIPILKMRRDSILERLKGEYRSGVKDFTNTIAEYVTYSDLINELERKLAQGE